MRLYNKVNLCIFFVCFLFVVLTISKCDVVLAKGDNAVNNKANEILVKYKDSSKINEINSKTLKNGKNIKFRVKKNLKNTKFKVLELDNSEDINVLIKELKEDSNVEYAQPNYTLSISADDEGERNRFIEQWALNNTEQDFGITKGRRGIDINALKAWDITQGNENVLVGLLDTGIDISHPSLSDRIYRNSDEIADNNIDDDNDGLIDNIYGGWDFLNDDSSIYDSKEYDDHGTLLAGIIAANGKVQGIKGAAPNIKLVPLKFMSGDFGYTSDAIEAIEFAKSIGIKIINCSFGSSSYNYALKDAMEDSEILFVCAVGNNGSDLNNSPVYPACFDLPNIITVASIDYNGDLTSFSNYGERADVAAPGLYIWTTKPGGGITSVKGTSVSTAYVTGVAALVKSNNISAGFSEIISRIKNNVVVSSSLEGKLSSGGRVDAYATLMNTKPTPDLSYDNTNEEKVKNNTTDVEEDGKYSFISDNSDGGIYAMTDDITLDAYEKIHYGESGVNPASGNFSFTYSAMR